jgi:hypothetical protein
MTYRLAGPLTGGEAEKHTVDVLGTHLARELVLVVAALLAVQHLTLRTLTAAASSKRWRRVGQ